MNNICQLKLEDEYEKNQSGNIFKKRVYYDVGNLWNIETRDLDCYFNNDLKNMIITCRVHLCDDGWMMDMSNKKLAIMISFITPMNRFDRLCIGIYNNQYICKYNHNSYMNIEKYNINSESHGPQSTFRFNVQTFDDIFIYLQKIYKYISISDEIYKLSICKLKIK